MEKIEFKVEFVRILYRTPTTKCFRIAFSLLPLPLGVPRSVGERAERVEMVVGVNKDVVELDKMGSLQMHFLAEDSNYYFPFVVQFIVDQRPTITRKIPVRLGKVRRQCEEGGGVGLDQVYAFEEGQIIYKVTHIRTTPLTHLPEIQ